MQFHANISTVPAIGVNKTSAATFNTLGCKRVCSEGQITRESTGAKKNNLHVANMALLHKLKLLLLLFFLFFLNSAPLLRRHMKLSPLCFTVTQLNACEIYDVKDPAGREIAHK